MKKFLTLIIAILLLVPTVFAVDKTSEDYLRGKKHISVMNPLVECVVEQEIKKALKKDTGANFKVKFEGYTLSSMKAGIFKYLEITGKNIIVENIFLPYVNLKSISNYNWVDYTKNPIEMKSDMVFAYEMKLSEKSINDALQHKDYQKTIQKVNKRAYPLFVLNNVRVKIKNNRLFIIMDYNFPINPSSKNKTFVVSTNFNVVNGVIKARDIGLDKAYGNMSLDKVTNLINLLDPLSFTLDLMNSQQCQGKVENIKLVDDMFEVNGRIFVNHGE